MTPRAPLLFVLSLAPAVAAAGPPAAGGAMAVNTYTTGSQYLPDVAASPSGGFVVVWESRGQDGSDGGVFAQRFGASGAPAGGEFRVNTYTTGWQGTPRVAAGANGRFVVVWASAGQDGSGPGVFGRVFDGGAAVTGEIPLGVHTTAGQTTPAVALDASGGFVVAWSSDGPDGGSYGIRARRFEASGAPAGGEIAVNAFTVGTQLNPSVAVAAAGGFVVGWDSLQDGSGPGVFLRRFDAVGDPLTGDVLVNTYTTNAQDTPHVVPVPGGGFVVAWNSMHQDGSVRGVFARRFDAALAPLGGEIAVNTYTYDAQQFPRVAVDPTGGFTVVWEGWTQDQSLGGVFGQSFDAAGARSGGEFRVNGYTVYDQGAPSIAADADGRMMVVWHSGVHDGLSQYLQDGSGYAVRAQRYGDLVFRDGFESGTLAAWSTSLTDDGDLATSPGAALDGAQGLQAAVDDTSPLFVQDESPADEGRYRARFLFDTNGFDTGEADLHRRTRVLIAFSEAPSRRVAAVVLRRLNGAYALLGRARLDSNAQADTGFFPIADGPHTVEIELVRASGPDASDGAFELWIDGVSVSRLESLDNALAEVDFARMGALSVKSAANGTLLFDAFESRRETYIGPVP